MPRRRKYPKLPNGYGSIKRLSGKRRNPFGVYPPTTEFDENGRPVSVPALAYVDDWYYGFSILTAYNAGTYVPGVCPAKPAIHTEDLDHKALDTLVKSLLADYGQMYRRFTQQEAAHIEQSPTFEDVYEQFYAWKFENGKKSYSISSQNATKAAFKNCSSLHNKTFRDLKYHDLQNILDQSTLKHASLEHIQSLLKQMYNFAELYELCDKNYAAKLRINIPDDNISGEPFTEKDLSTLWKHQEDPTVEFLLIMCYSGHRIAEYQVIETDLKQGCFRGGLKTKSGRDRIVPIHSQILPLVQRRLKRDGSLLNNPVLFRKQMYTVLEALNLPRHTPHDCRHTFSMLCEHYGVRENDRKRMLGHSFQNDVTNAVYGHRSLEDLKAEIEKIKVSR